MTPIRTLLVVVASLVPVTGATAETRLTEFNGVWRGTGQDRDGPLRSMQDTVCQNTVRATLRRMNSEMTCERKSGVRKQVRLTVELAGDRFTGRVTQRTIRPDREDAVISGTIAGKKTDSSATFIVTWKGATPNATVNLKLNTPASYAMNVTALGLTMMDMTFTRTAERAPPR